MSVLMLVLLGAAAAFAVTDMFAGDDDDMGNTSDPTTGDENADDSEGEIVPIDTMLDAAGTGGDDVFTYAAGVSGSVTTDIDAGAGDDTIDLASPFDEASLDAASVQGGDGDDVIRLQGALTTISGGAGDDTIFADLMASEVEGDSGDDMIRVTNISSDATDVDGGSGDDTIDVTGSDNINVTGGAGDDLLLSDGRAPGGTGYAITIDGGSGDDTLFHTAEVFPLPPQDAGDLPAHLTGGDGADTFAIALSVGSGSFAASDDDPTMVENTAAVLTDFTPGLDRLELEIPSSLAGYTAETATLTEDPDGGTTTISVALTSDSLPDQSFNVVVEATGLSWSDVTFTDLAPGSLRVA